MLAHYGELEWVSLIHSTHETFEANKPLQQARSFGVAPDLVRISVGLEDAHKLEAIFDRALDAAKRAQESET